MTEAKHREHPIFGWLLEELALDYWEAITAIGRRIILHLMRIEEDKACAQDYALNLDFLDTHLVPTQSARSYLYSLFKFVYLTFDHNKYYYLPSNWDSSLHPDILAFIVNYATCHQTPEFPSIHFAQLIGRVVQFIILSYIRKSQGFDLVKMYIEKYPFGRSLTTNTLKALNQKIVQLKKKQSKQVIWAQFFHHQRVWVRHPNQKPSRPYSIHIAETTKKFKDIKKIIFSTVIMSKELPNETQNLDALFKAINELNYIPTIIAMQCGDHACSSQNMLLKLGIETIHWSQCIHPYFSAVLCSLDQKSKAAHPGEAWQLETCSLTHVVSPEHVRGFYHSCAYFWKAKPWLKINSTLSIAIQDTDLNFQRGKLALIAVTGFDGKEIGLKLQQNNVRKTTQPHMSVSVLFGPQHDLPFDDLDEIEVYGFEIADENAYPNVCVLDGTTKTPKRLTHDQIQFCEATFLALPKFAETLTEPLNEGTQVKTQTIEITASYGQVNVHISQADYWNEYPDDFDSCTLSEEDYCKFQEKCLALNIPHTALFQDFQDFLTRLTPFIEGKPKILLHEKDATALSILIHRLFELKKYTMIAKYTTEIQKQWIKQNSTQPTEKEDLSKKTNVELKTMLKGFGVNYTDCFERSDLIEKAQKLVESQRGCRDKYDLFWTPAAALISLLDKKTDTALSLIQFSASQNPYIWKFLTGSRGIPAKTREAEALSLEELTAVNYCLFNRSDWVSTEGAALFFDKILEATATYG